MRIATALLISSFAFPLIVTACSTSNPADADPFDTLQECFDEHHNMESLPVQQAIVTCCVDHPIAGVKPSCGATMDDCVAHVDANISSTEVTVDDIDMACATYIQDK